MRFRGWAQSSCSGEDWETSLNRSCRGRRRHSLRGALFFLVGSLIAGSIVYHFSAESLLSAWDPAQAASLQGQ
jgi:hypothetical protein